MRTTKAISVTLTRQMAELVKAKVASGEYASESEVVREGLRALEERDAATEAWLREAVVPTLTRLREGKEPLLSPDAVLDRIGTRQNRRRRAHA